VAGHPMPLEAYAPTALDYPTASICLARPIVIRTFALPQMSPILGHKDRDAWAPVFSRARGTLAATSGRAPHRFRYPASVAVPDEGLIDKARALHRRSHPQVRRVVVAVVGFLLLCVGIALLVLPGPGLLVIAAGIAVLALEFPWAERLAKRIQVAVETVLRRLKLLK